jgi:hypothetical protein
MTNTIVETWITITKRDRIIKKKYKTLMKPKYYKWEFSDKIKNIIKNEKKLFIDG